MPRACTICTHNQRGKIEQALLKGESVRVVAARFGTSTSTLQRHKAHLPAELVRAKQAAEVSQSDDLLQKVANLENDARRIQRKAEAAGDLRTAVSAIRELTRVIELLAKLRGEIQSQPQFNITFVIPVLLDALSDFPEARQVVAKRLQAIEAATP